MRVELNNVTKIIGKNTVLNDVNIAMESGKIYGFYGRNGSGKTMLFRGIAGLIVLTKGTITFDNEILHKDIRIPKNLGIIIENPGFWDYYTGYENLKALASIKNLIDDTIINNALELVGLFDVKDNLYKKYSLGMKQRLAIAQSIMESPEILLLDEPTNALDQEGMDMLRKVLMDLKKKNVLIAIASHNKEDINLLADVKVRMENGCLEVLDGDEPI